MSARSGLLFLGSGTDAIMTTRPIRVSGELASATAVTFWAYAGRVDSVGVFHVELYNETDAVAVVALSSSIWARCRGIDLG